MLDDETKALVLAVRDLLKDLRARGLNDDQIDTLWFLSRYDLEEGNTAKALEHLNKALDSRFSPLNYKTKQDFENEIARLKA